MKKINIVRKNEDFNRIIKKLAPITSRYFIIYIEPSDNNYKFGISVSKKIGNAVIRNRIKRQIKSIIDKKLYQKKFNCIIIIKKSILNENFIGIEKDLINLFIRANIIEGETNEKHKI